MIYQRIGAACGLVTALCTGLERFVPPQPLIVLWLTVVSGVLALAFLLVGAIMHRREAPPR